MRVGDRGDCHRRGDTDQQHDGCRHDQLNSADGADHFDPSASCRCAGSTPSNVQNVVAGGHATVIPNRTGTVVDEPSLVVIVCRPVTSIPYTPGDAPMPDSRFAAHDDTRTSVRSTVTVVRSRRIDSNAGPDGVNAATSSANRAES